MKLEPVARMRHLEPVLQGASLERRCLFCPGLHLIVAYKKNQHLCLECHNSAHINKDNQNRTEQSGS